MDSPAAGSGGPNDPGMDMRLQRLEEALPRIEALLKSIDDRLRNVEIGLAELRGRMVNLPSTWAMLTTMLGGQVAFAAVIFAMLRFVGAH
jgi:hypothetical protein